MKRYRLPHSLPFDQCGGFHQPICFPNTRPNSVITQEHANTLSSPIIAQLSHPNHQRPRRRRDRLLTRYLVRHFTRRAPDFTSPAPPPTPTLTPLSPQRSSILPQDAKPAFTTPPAPDFSSREDTRHPPYHTINHTPSPPPATHLLFHHTARRRLRIHPPTTSCSAIARAPSNRETTTGRAYRPL